MPIPQYFREINTQ